MGWGGEGRAGQGRATGRVGWGGVGWGRVGWVRKGTVTPSRRVAFIPTSELSSTVQAWMVAEWPANKQKAVKSVMHAKCQQNCASRADHC